MPARTTQYTYTAAGQIQSVTDAAGQTSTYAYNAAGDLTGITDPLQHATTFAHDAFGRVTRTTDAAGRETRVTYDARGRVLTVTAPGNQVTTYTYDTAGRRAGIVAPGGRTTTYAYDPYGRLATVSDAAGTTTYGYDLRSQVIALRDAKGQTTRYQYDLRGRLQQTLVEGDLAETYTYDALDRLATRTDRRGVTTTVAYDAAGRLARQTYSDGTPAVSYSYDALGRLTTAANETATVTRTYTAAGELLTEASSLGGPEVRCTYDAAGRRASVALDASPLVTYGYDAASRLTTLQWAGRTVSLGYDATSLRTSLTYPNGIETTYAVNPAVQLTEVLAQRPATSAVVDRTGYTYDVFGRRETKTRATGAEAYGYDPVGRLATIARDGVPAASYTYDAVGNRQTGPTPPEVWTASPRNELLTSPGAASRYDAAGRLIEQVRAGQSWRYAWNARSELVRVERDGLEVARFAYDPFGRRVRKVVAGVETQYTYDGDDIVLEHRTQNGAEVATWTYLHGPGIDEPLARHDATGTVAYYHADGLGSITTLTDDTGAVVATRTYDAWGNLESGAAEDGYAFTGREWEPAIGLYYYRARWYDPQAGRFISEDPIGFAAGDPNLYAYTFGDPVNLTDPSGEIVPALLAIGAAAYATAEFALSVYDAYDTYRTLRDPNVSATMKVVAAGFFVAGALLPGGGYSKIDDAAECVVKAVKGRGKGLTTPARFFGDKTAKEASEALGTKFGPPRSSRPGAETFFNPKTGRSYNVHTDPAHGPPHVDVRTRGPIQDRKVPLQGGGN